MMNDPSSEPSVPSPLPSNLPPTLPGDAAPQLRASHKPMWIAITAGSIALTAGIVGGMFAYMTHLEHERQAEENARVIAAMEARHREEMESRKQQLRERLAAKEEEVRREAEKAEERARAWKREQEEAKRKAEEERQKQAEKEQQEKERAEEAAQAGKDAEAVEYYKQACDAGSADAAYHLGLRYSRGKGLASNLYRAAELYRLAAERGSAEGAFAYGKCLIEGNGISANADEGLEWVNKAADNGMWEAKDFLAERKTRANESAHVVFPDLQPLIDRMARLKCKQAISAYQQRQLLILLPRIRNGESVDITTPDMAGHTALHYACGIGSLSITTWLVKHGANVNAVADNGDTPLSSVGADNSAAITRLLREYGAWDSCPAWGNDVPPEEPGPVSAEDQCTLGYNYQYGKGVPQSYAKAFYWYKKAADQGLPVAHNNLGFCYLNGWGGKKNESLAYKHFRIAAEAGVPLAQSNLGTCYEFGNGVKPNKAEAIRWYRKAAAQGNPSAQKHLRRLGL